MLKVDQYGKIRRAHQDGLGVRQIARQFHHSKRTVRKALAQAEPQPYRRGQAYAAPKLGKFHPIIDAILREDEEAPLKQRHTAAQIFRRLQSEQGYAGGYDQVRRYLQRQRRRQRETFIPLTHGPGQRAEADFGHIYVDFPTGRQQVPVLLVTWSYSYMPFALGLPTERTEAILHGLVAAFGFFGCVPRELWWDNPRTVAAAILRGRHRQVNERYQALASHYRFEPLFCLPGHGNEKPAVENRVYDLQRRWATPVPVVLGFDELNAHLRRCCEAERDRVSGSNTETIGARFSQDCAKALSLPAYPFDPCVRQTAQVDKYQLARFDNNSYSVPRAYAFQTVTIKAYVERIDIVVEDQMVAAHRRSYGKGDQVLDPLHYLVTLGRRPAALDHAAVYRDWKLPATFLQLRRELEASHGAKAGLRHYVRVLQLLAGHPLERVVQAIDHGRGHGCCDAERINAHVERLAARSTVAAMSDIGMSVNNHDLTALQVPRPDLGRFNWLLSQGEPDYAAPADDALENQPQAPAFARHECRV